MGWKPTGSPTVEFQRGLYSVRVQGIDTETGRRRPKQLGTYKTRREATAAATRAAAEGQTRPRRATVGRLVDAWVASRTDVAVATLAQYEWATGHIRKGLGSMPIDKLDRFDISRWLEDLADGGTYSRRSLMIFQTVLRAALADAFAAGEIRRNPDERVPVPRRNLGAIDAQRQTKAWTDTELQQFLATARGHRWEVPLRLTALYGLRRSELLGLCDGVESTCTHAPSRSIKAS